MEGTSGARISSSFAGGRVSSPTAEGARASAAGGSDIPVRLLQPEGGAGP
jgi:hypothetical protein